MNPCDKSIILLLQIMTHYEHWTLQCDRLYYFDMNRRNQSGLTNTTIEYWMKWQIWDEWQHDNIGRTIFDRMTKMILGPLVIFSLIDGQTMHWWPFITVSKMANNDNNLLFVFYDKIYFNLRQNFKLFGVTYKSKWKEKVKIIGIAGN